MIQSKENILILQKIILALLLTLQPHNEDLLEEKSSRIDRLNLIASSIVEASENVMCNGSETVEQRKYCWSGNQEDLAIVLITKGWAETRFNKRIHNGKCYDNECDPIWKKYSLKDGKQISYVSHWRAKSNWQIHQQRFISNDVWRQIGFSTEYSTTLAATNAAKILAFGRNRCGGWNDDSAIERGMALYATGKTCKWSGTRSRMWLFKNLQNKAQNIDYLTSVLTQNNITIDVETNDKQIRFVNISQDVHLKYN